MKRGLFITAEGTDGCGKTTQINIMADYLRKKGLEVILTREPGGTKISEKIRAILLDTSNEEMGILTEVLLYASARAQLVYEVVEPALKNGKIVICDRFIDSSFAYQGFGRGVSLGVLNNINSSAVNGIMPDITFFFDLDPVIALKRRIDSAEADRIEKENINFHKKVYEGYNKLAGDYPERIKTIDSNRNIDEIALQIRGYLDNMLKEEYM